MLDVDDHILEDAVLDFESMMQRDAEHDAIIEEEEAMLCEVLDEMETLLDAEPLITPFEPTSECANPESLQQEGGALSEPDPVPGPSTRSLNGLYDDIMTSFRTNICPWCKKSFPRRPELEQHFLISHPEFYQSAQFGGSLNNVESIPIDAEMESHENATVRRYAADLSEVECDDITQLFSS
jgi:hypothetical protein